MYSYQLVWRGKGNCTEDKYVFKLVILFVAYVTKLVKSDIFEQTTTFMAACYGQPQYSTMTEGRQNQWAGKQAPDHCPITVLIASNKWCIYRKT